MRKKRIGISWIASYPKSGNTWVRFIVSALRLGEIHDSSQVEQSAPDVHKLRGQTIDLGSTPFLKTHWKFGANKLFEHSIGVLYITRNPMDCLISNLNYLNVSDAKSRRYFIDEFLDVGGLRHWMKFGFATWEENVKSWMDQGPNQRCLFLRYEEMLSAPETAIRRIADFIGISAEDILIEKVLRATSFQNMKRMENEELHANRQRTFFTSEAAAKGKEGFKFMRKGAFGAYRDELSSEDVDQFLKRFEPTLLRAGYCLDDFQSS